MAKCSRESGGLPLVSLSIVLKVSSTLPGELIVFHLVLSSKLGGKLVGARDYVFCHYNLKTLFSLSQSSAQYFPVVIH